MPKIYFISGVSGVGKSSLIPHLRALLPVDRYDVHDLDERGVPDGGGKAWHDKEMRHWIDVGNENATKGISTIICGFAQPEGLAEVGLEGDLEVCPVMLDASDDTLRSRLIGRHTTPQSIAEIERASGKPVSEFIDKMVADAPLVRDLFKKHSCTIVNTDGKTPLETAGEIAKLILSGAPQETRTTA